MRQFIPLILALSVMTAACGENDRKPPAAVSDSASRAGTAPEEPGIEMFESPSSRDTGYNPANAKNFPLVVRKEFSHMAVSMPKHVSDSFMKLRDPVAIDSAMTRYLHHRDTLARMALCRKYGISMDSLDRIIRKK